MHFFDIYIEPKYIINTMMILFHVLSVVTAKEVAGYLPLVPFGRHHRHYCFLIRCRVIADRLRQSGNGVVC